MRDASVSLRPRTVKMTDLFLTTRGVGNYRWVAVPANSAFAVQLGTQGFFDIRRGHALIFQFTLALALGVVS